MTFKVGNTVLRTGATSGLGTALAREFAIRRWTVLAHGRDAARLAALRGKLESLGATVHVLHADVTEPASVAAMCDEVTARVDRLDVLIDNAAVGGGVDPTRRETNASGTELRMAGNYLAPRLLNWRHLPRAAPAGRIVNVVSIGQAPLVVDDLNRERDYDGVTAYCRSKLALIMDTVDLASELAGDGITVNAVHPAQLMPTQMVADSGFTTESSVADGLLPVLRLALDSTLGGVNGQYFDRFDAADAHPQSREPLVRAALAAWGHDRLPAAAVSVGGP